MRRYCIAGILMALWATVCVLAMARGNSVVQIIRPCVVPGGGGWVWPSAGSVLRLSFDADTDPTIDTSEAGTNHFATLSGTTSESTWLASNETQSACRQFDGVNDWCSNGQDFAQVFDTNFSMRILLFPEGTNYCRPWCSTHVQSTYYQWIMTWGWDSNRSCAIVCYSNAVTPDYVSAYFVGPGWETGVWYDVIFSKSNTTAYFWTNGYPVDNVGGSLPENILSSNSIQSIGGWYRPSLGTFAAVFKGKIDEPSFWIDKVFSDAEVLDLYNNGKGGPRP